MAIAQLIGLNPKWIQHPGTDAEHFDVVQSKRAAAIKAGAQPVSWRHAGEFFAARRKAADAERHAEADNPDLIPRSQPVNRLLLVTGPRKGVPRAAVETALKPYFSPTTMLVEGDADGVDKDSASLWESWGGLVERHPVSQQEWDANPKGAGHARNRRMVDRLSASGNGQVLAIDLPCTKDDCRRREPHFTHGTSGCVTEAEKAGLKVDHFKAAEFTEAPPKAVDLAQAATEADLAAREAPGNGDYDRALTWLAAAKELDPGNAAVFEQHERQVRTAMPIVPQRRECTRCGEPGSQYPNGEYRCDGHKPQPAFQPAREVALTQDNGTCPVCQTANLTYGRTRCQACGAVQGQEPRDIEYRDLSHGNPGHMCIQPQRAERQPS
jgi:hypothetical protein